MMFNFTLKPHKGMHLQFAHAKLYISFIHCLININCPQSIDTTLSVKSETKIYSQESLKVRTKNQDLIMS